MADAFDELVATFPWIERLGVRDLIEQLAIEGVVGDAALARLRQSPQYQAMFPAIRRSDGTLRMSERAYLERQSEFQELLRDFDKTGYGYDAPEDFVAFFEGEIDPNELRDRLTIYDNLRRNGHEIRDAFYVYAGIRMSDDDLYSYVVDPSTRVQFDNQYAQATAQGTLDYETWITRATEAGLSRVAQSLEQLAEDGVQVGGALQRIRQLDSNFARQMMDVLYSGGDPLPFNDLLNAFESALIGSAASAQGLGLPDRDRIQALRLAGVERSRALEAYGQFSRDRNQLSAIVARATGGAKRRFTQDDFERAIFLNQGDVSGLLQRAAAQEESMGRRSGSFNFEQGQGGLLAQRGMAGGLNAA